jgi:hypothetical protein
MKVMRAKAFSPIILLSLLCCGAQVQAESNTSTGKQPPYSIVFSGWYHAGTEKCRGPYHRTLLFAWFTKTTSAANLTDYRALIER